MTAPRPQPGKRWPRRFGLALLVAALVAGGVFAYQRLKAPPPPKPPGIPANYSDQEVVRALTVAAKKVEQAPLSAEAWGHLGQLYLANEIGEQADYCFRQAERLDARNPHWPYYLALSNLPTDTQETVACLRRAIERADRADPAITSPRLQLATLLIQDAKYDEAAELLRLVRAKEPGNAQAIYLAGLLQAGRGDLRGGAALLRLVADNPAARQKACTKLAELHQRLGNSAAADEWARTARDAPEDTHWPDAYAAELLQWALSRDQRLGQAARLQREQRYAEAVAMLKQILESEESPPAAVYESLGNNLVHLGQHAEAEQAFEAVLRLSPNDVETHTRLALIRLFQGEIRENKFGDRPGAEVHYRRARASAEKAVQLKPDLGESRATLGQILLALGERKAAITELRASLRSRPEVAHTHLLLGEALAADGHLPDARPHLESAVKFAPKGDPRPREALDRFEKQHGKPPVPK